MAVRMEISLRQLSKQWQDSNTHVQMVWYLLINANLINAKQMLRYYLFFKQ